ncbi:hypothetical protein BC829DRAFT_419714 [Chytridium lagenaria]|nr:hypothetical protein BC829DRAFT_419714 [Chytridium lagenaria]
MRYLRNLDKGPGQLSEPYANIKGIWPTRWPLVVGLHHPETLPSPGKPPPLPRVPILLVQLVEVTMMTHLTLSYPPVPLLLAVAIQAGSHLMTTTTWMKMRWFTSYPMRNTPRPSNSSGQALNPPPLSNVKTKERNPYLSTKKSSSVQRPPTPSPMKNPKSVLTVITPSVDVNTVVLTLVS